MAVVLTELFETGGEGAAIGTGNSVFDAITGTGSAVFAGAQHYEGSKSGLITAATNNIALERDLTAAGKLCPAFGIRQVSAPSAVATLCNLYSAGTTVANLRMNTSGTLNFRDSTTSRWTSTTVLALNTWYEVHMICDAAADTAQVKIYDATGALLEASPSLTMSVVATATMNEIRIGSIAGNITWQYYLDRLIVDDAAEPAVLPSSTPYLYYDTGSAWVDVSNGLYYDNGTTWEQVIVGTP